MQINLSHEEVVEAIQNHLVKQGVNRQLNPLRVSVSVPSSDLRFPDFDIVVEIND